MVMKRRIKVAWRTGNNVIDPKVSIRFWWGLPLRPHARTARKTYAPNRPHALRAHPRSSSDADPVREELHVLAPIVATATYEEAYGAHLTPKIKTRWSQDVNA